MLRQVIRSHIKPYKLYSKDNKCISDDGLWCSYDDPTLYERQVKKNVSYDIR